MTYGNLNKSPYYVLPNIRYLEDEEGKEKTLHMATGTVGVKE